MRRTLAIVVIGFAFACASASAKQPALPSTLGEQASGFGYIPLDGLAVHETLDADSCRAWRDLISKPPEHPVRSDIPSEQKVCNPFIPLLGALPDITVRFAVASVDASGGLNFGPVKITAKGGRYRAILDYVNVDVIPVNMVITAFNDGTPVSITSLADETQVKRFTATADTSKFKDAITAGGEVITIPVYVGIGMRLSADIAAFEGGISLTSLGAIGIDAQAKRLTGTLTVQTIGVTGENVATALPLPSRLDQTSIENGILAIGGIRAVLYSGKEAASEGDITITPRILGFHSPIQAGPRLSNAIHAELAKQPPRWHRPCWPTVIRCPESEQ